MGIGSTRSASLLGGSTGGESLASVRGGTSLSWCAMQMCRPP